MYSWDGGNMMGYGAWWGMGWLFMALFWLAIILAVVALLKWLLGSSARSDEPRPKDALEILKERYARGEIGREEFQEKKRDLG